MPDFVARNKSSFGMVGVFLLAMVIAHMGKKDEAAVAASESFGPNPQVELSDQSGVKTPVVVKKKKKRDLATGYTEAEVEGGGTIKGVARLDKTITLWTIPHSKDQDKGCAHDPMPTERIVVGADGLTLANCVVYIEGIASGKAWAGEFGKGPDDRTALLDQKGCKYIPHILPVRVETQIGLNNADKAEHNVHTYDAAGRTGINQMTPGESFLGEVGSAYIVKAGTYTVKCDIHPWMNGYIWAFHHPYWAITGADGRFELTGVPPGTYTVVCWHEGMQERAAPTGGGGVAYTYGPDVELRATVTVAADGTVTQDFTVPAPK